MNTLTIGLFAGITTVLLLLLRRKRYEVSYGIMIALIVFLGTIGYFGAALASYLAFDSWTGIRFYGKVAFVTIALLGVSKVVKIDAGKIMDYYAPVDIAALAIMKFNCVRAGCCSGIAIGGSQMTFPSQIVELLTAIATFLLLMWMERTPRYDGMKYPIYLIVYGSTRFVFEVLREEQGNFLQIGICRLSVGHIFCIILLFMGVGILARHITKNAQKKT